jgi:hypothetical protein
LSNKTKINKTTQRAMKQLAFEIAHKIATDKNPNTVIICASILKEAFIMSGVNKKDANTMAIDGIKIIMKSMLNLTK